jgi:hypothetical protein
VLRLQVPGARDLAQVTLPPAPTTLPLASDTCEARPAAAMLRCGWRDRPTPATPGRRHRPPITIEREPQVPVENGHESVSPCKTLDALELDPQHLVRDLRERGLVALAVRMGADPDLEWPSAVRPTVACS